MAICLRYAAREEDAMEMVNDGFMKLYKGLTAFVPMYDNHYLSLKSWLKQIMIHTSIDHYRKNNKHGGHLEIGADFTAPSYIVGYSIDKLSYDEIRKVVQQLSPTYRTVFNLFVIDGFSHEEISKQLNISVGTSKSNLSKAKMNLQTMIQKLDKAIYERRAVW